MRHLMAFVLTALVIATTSEASADIVTPSSVTVNAAGDNPIFRSVFGPFAGTVDNLINGNEVTEFGSSRKGFLDANGDQLPDADFTLANVLSGDVLHDAIFTSETPLGAFHWLTDPRAGEPADFFAPPNASDPVVLTFNLGGSHSLDGVLVWRYTGGSTFGNLQGNNPSAWTIELSNDGGGSYGSPIALDPVSLVEDDSTTEDVIEGAGGLPAELLSFPAADADFVRITISDNSFGSGLNVLGGDRVGLAELHFKSAAAGLAGDFNGDGSVDAADYTTWRDGLNTTFTPADYSTWASNFGATSPPAVAVPEPSGIALWFAGVSLAACKIRRRVGG